jgi:hypothetical protein
VNPRRLLAVLAAAALCGPASALADDMVTDRPDFTESAVTVPRRRVQLEAGVTLSSSGNDFELALGEALVRIGLHPALELRLAIPSYLLRFDGDVAHIFDVSHRVAEGFAEPGLGAKLQLLRGGEGFSFARPDLALIVGATAPPLDDALGDDAWSGEAKLCAAWSPPGRYGYAVNLNAEHSEVGGGEGTGSASASIGIEIAETIGAYVEWFGFRSLARAEASTQWADGGLTWAPVEDLQFDVRYGVALHRGDDRFIGAGVSRRW